MYYICSAIKKMLLLHPNLREIIHKPILYLITKLQIMENVKKCPPQTSVDEVYGGFVCCGFVALCF